MTVLNHGSGSDLKRALGKTPSSRVQSSRISYSFQSDMRRGSPVAAMSSMIARTSRLIGKRRSTWPSLSSQSTAPFMAMTGALGRKRSPSSRMNVGVRPEAIVNRPPFA